MGKAGKEIREEEEWNESGERTTYVHRGRKVEGRNEEKGRKGSSREGRTGMKGEGRA